MDKEKKLPIIQATKALSVAGKQSSLISRGLSVIQQLNTEALDDNSAARQWELGCEYMKGDDAERDYERAFYWFFNAAEQGHAEAQFALGTLYAAGDGVQQNTMLAMEWFGKASDQGHAWARRKLAELQGV